MHRHLPPVNVDASGAVVDAHRGLVPSHEALLAVALDDAGLARSLRAGKSDAEAERMVQSRRRGRGGGGGRRFGRRRCVRVVKASVLMHVVEVG